MKPARVSPSIVTIRASLRSFWANNGAVTRHNRISTGYRLPETDNLRKGLGMKIREIVVFNSEINESHKNIKMPDFGLFRRHEIAMSGQKSAIGRAADSDETAGIKRRRRTFY